MGIERVTRRPGFYADEPELWDIPAMEAEADKLWKDRAKDKFYLVLPIAMRRKPSAVRLTVPRRRQVAQIIGCVTNEKAIFHKQTNYYQVGGWSIGDWTTATPLFSLEERQSILPVLDALAQAGYGLTDDIELHWRQPEQKLDTVLAISELVERKSVSLKQLLQLKADMRFIIEKDTCVFDIALETLSSEAMNRVLLVVRRMILQGMESRQEAERRPLGTSA